MKKIISLLCLFFVSLCLQAQNISVSSFALDERDLTANLHGTTVLDQNGEKCALIRIQTIQKGFSFDVGVLGVQKVDDSKTGEVWVYVPRGVKRLTIRHPQLGSLTDYPFPVNIEPTKTYRMVLVTGNVKTIVEQDDGKSYISLSVKPANAFVMIDGEMKQLDEEGTLMLRMPRGEHTYTIQAAGYTAENGTFTLGAERLNKSIELRSKHATLTVSCATPGAQIYVNDELRGTGPWSGSLLPGDYLIEARKESHYSQKQSVTLAENEQKTIALPELVARTGSLDVAFSPIDCDVLVDGKKIGTSPNLFRPVLMGSHEIEIKKAGYAPFRQSIAIEEGKTFTMTGKLKKQTAQTNDVAFGSSDIVSGASNVASGSSILPITVKGVTFNMVKVEGGTFTMGATPEQGGDAQKDENPAHQVTLSSYYIGETEVTQALWETVMGKNRSKWKGVSLPVEKVSWKDCQEFVEKLNTLTGKRFRLPTEAEWEYAARGGNKSKGYKYSGSNFIDDVAWYADNSGNKTHVVKTKLPNELGIYDMTGNVQEWCQDWYGFYSSSSQTNPTGPSNGPYRVLRGGSWNNSARFCRVSNRNGGSPSGRNYYLGLRLVLSE